MKYLVATTDTQGTVEGDFSWCEEGEIVTFPTFICHPWDDACGCGRAYSGITTHRSTTSAVVVDDPDLTDPQLRRIVAASLVDAGWSDDPDLTSNALDPLLAWAEQLPVGTVVGVRAYGSDNDPEPPQLEVRIRRTPEDVGQ